MLEPLRRAPPADVLLMLCVALVAAVVVACELEPPFVPGYMFNTLKTLGLQLTAGGLLSAMIGAAVSLVEVRSAADEVGGGDGRWSHTSWRRALAVAMLLLLVLYPGSPLFLSLTWWYQTYGLEGAMSQTSEPLSKVRVLRSHRLIFCAIEKNANTAFEDLLCSLSHRSDPVWMRWLTSGWVAATWRTWADFELPCFWSATRPERQGLSPEATWRAFYHRQPSGEPRWTSAVFVRDPLERFLSGWLSKCTPDHDLDREVCAQVFGSRNASFERAVSVIDAMTAADFGAGVAEDHFRLQSAFCNGTVGRREFDHYYTLDRRTSRELTAEMLGLVGLENPSEATLAFDYHFPPSPEPPAAAAAPIAASAHAALDEGDVGAEADGLNRGNGFDHVTNANQRLTQYYSSSALVRPILRHYAPDYRQLPLTVPRWAIDIVGADFVRSLGLEA